MKAIEWWTTDGATTAAGDTWTGTVLVYDADRGYATADTLTATLYDAAGVEVADAVTVERVRLGEYRVAVAAPAPAGIYRLKVDGTTATVWQLLDVADPFAAPPTVADVVAVIGDTAATEYGEPAIEAALAEESAAQRDACDIPAAGFPASLRRALIRRVQVNLAMNGQPVAVTDPDGAGGRPVGLDPIVRQLERRYPRMTVG